MKHIGMMIAGGLALAFAAAPAVAQHHTTVTRVHGPLKVLPHHNRKYCQVRYMHHKRVRKCWYH